MLTRSGASSRRPARAARSWRRRVPTATVFGIPCGPGTGSSVVGGTCVDAAARRRGRSSPRVAADHEAPPGEGEEQRHLGAQRLGLRPASSRHRPRGRGWPSAQRRALGARGKRSSARRLDGLDRGAAAHLQDRRELDQAAAVDEVVQPPAPHPLARVLAQPAEPVAQRRASGWRPRGRAPRRRAARSRRAGGRRRRCRPATAAVSADPVVVEVRELTRREGQRVVEQLAREQRGGAGHRVGHEQRGAGPVVVAADRLQ